MIVHGLGRLTLLDYPEHTACTLFTGACNFRCPFCQNGALVLHPDSEPVIPEDEIFAFLEKRRGMLDGVCITGGEPTLQRDLETFIDRVKELGYLVKLDTNGTNPDLLERLISFGKIDMVAMDIKSSRERYFEAAGLEPVGRVTVKKEEEREEKGGPRDFMPEWEERQGDADVSSHSGMKLLQNVERSASLLLEGRIPYEFRTTMVRELVSEEDIRSIGLWLAGAERYYLQSYEDSEGVIDRSLHGYTPDEMKRLCGVVQTWIPSAKIRGIS